MALSSSSAPLQRQPLLKAMTSLVQGLTLAPQQAFRHLCNKTACRETNVLHFSAKLQPLQSYGGWSVNPVRNSLHHLRPPTSAHRTSVAATSCRDSSFQRLRVDSSKTSFLKYQPDSWFSRSRHSKNMATEALKDGHDGFLEEGAPCPEGYRPNVGVCLVNADDQVFVANRLDMENAWQMPQARALQKNIQFLWSRG